MRIGYICSETDRRTDEVLSRVAERAARAGIALGGTVQPVDRSQPAEKCRIVLRVLPDGPVCDVSTDLGPGASGCRLDAGALEQAMVLVNDRLPGAQALVVNKFGKQEAAGRGLVGAIGSCAGERGLPVLVGVSPEWLPAFLAFAEGAAQSLDADEDRVFDWLQTAVARTGAGMIA